MTDNRTEKTHANQGSTENSKEGAGKTWYEEFTVSGADLLTKVKEIVAEGNVRRLYIKNTSGRTLLEVPLTVGVAVAAVTLALAPALAAIGAIAAMLAKVTLGVERTTTPESPAEKAADQEPQS